MLPVSSACHIFLHGHQKLVLPCKPKEQLLIQRLHKPHIDQAALVAVGLQKLPHLQRCFYHAAHCHQGDLRLIVNHLALAVHNRSPELLQPVIGLPSGIADCNRVLKPDGIFHHIRKLPFILRG